MTNVNVILAGTGPVGCLGYNNELGFLEMILHGFKSDTATGWNSWPISVSPYGDNGIGVVAVIDSAGFAFNPNGFSKGELETIIDFKKGTFGKKGHFDGREEIGVSQFARNTNDYGSYVGILKFIKDYMNRNGQKFVFVDATSSDYSLAALSWATMQNGNWSVVSANKRPYALDPDSDKLLADQMALFNGIFTGSVYNRATVGADLGVPLALAHILKKESPKNIMIDLFASGTCNTTLTTADKLSEGLHNAVEKKYTETYPIEDLDGGDLLRKGMICAKEIAVYFGIPFKAIKVVSKESLLDAALALHNKKNGGDVDIDILRGLTGYDFVDYVRRLDGAFSQLQDQAASNGNVLRYGAIVTFDGHQISVSTGLKPCPLDSAAAGLYDRNNLIQFTYGRNQLVLGPGPGAGFPETPRALLRGVLYHMASIDDSSRSGLVLK